MITNAVIAAITLIAGLFTGILIKNSEIKRLELENKKLSEKNEELTEKNNRLNAENSKNTALINSFETIREQIKNEFTLIANQVIKAEQSGLMEQNRVAVEEKLKPVKESFENLKNKLEAFNKEGEVNAQTIKTQIETLVNESKDIEKTANKLANAINNNSKERGNFGEMILDNLLKQAGLVNKKDDEEKGNYITQKKYTDMKTQETYMPDAVVFFPDNKHIIIDSKCPLNNFIEYCNAESETEKNEQINLFYKSAEKMIDDLSKKYDTLEGLNTPEFKLMFIPLEACANYIYQKSNIIEKASKNNIIIVCPSTLLATLKIIHKTWKDKNQEKYLFEIVSIAKAIYEKTDIFLRKAFQIQSKIKSAEESFEELNTSFKGKGGIKPLIEKLEKCGINSAEKISEKYLEDGM